MPHVWMPSGALLGTRQFEECREEHKKAQAEFDAVAEKRYSKFMATFDVISDEIDKVLEG